MSSCPVPVRLSPDPDPTSRQQQTITITTAGRRRRQQQEQNRCDLLVCLRLLENLTSLFLENLFREDFIRTSPAEDSPSSFPLKPGSPPVAPSVSSPRPRLRVSLDHRGPAAGPPAVLLWTDFLLAQRTQNDVTKPRPPEQNSAFCLGSSCSDQNLSLLSRFLWDETRFRFLSPSSSDYKTSASS